MTGIESELAEAFAAASDFIEAPQGLHRQVRRAARRRRRTTVAALTACAVLAVAAGVRYASTADQSPVQASLRPRAVVALKVPIAQIAAGPHMLYLVTNPPRPGPQKPPILLQAYDLPTGRLVHRVRLPAVPSALMVGRGGLVWVAFPDESGVLSKRGQAEVWLFNPDLSYRSQASAQIWGDNILPTGETTALAVTPTGIESILMPVPGEKGQATVTAIDHTSIGARAVSVYWAGWLRGRVAAERLVNKGGSTGYDDITIAGEPGLRFGGSTRTIHSVASDGSSLWVVSPLVADLTGGGMGLTGFPLIRLDSRLQITTPGFVRADPVLNSAQQVWSDGSTVWVSRQVPPALACFAASSQDGPVMTIRLGGQALGLAFSGGTVLVSTNELTGHHLMSYVTSYRVPAACR